MLGFGIWVNLGVKEKMEKSLGDGFCLFGEVGLFGMFWVCGSGKIFV